ncbi:UDP-glucuronic acid decarboxylase family protein [Pelagibacterium sediminicola]|uniref:UDP-glucuronic acid decarboxylase family protein n=1 Tax=Pelagibacterium sediminicola TaxID=2248761 RepID=UPI000E324C25|nr:UDP-glucuronic acid decarboxylase family protein [Pelagibacterium sediminicola]
MKRQRILVTGGAGFLGSNLCRELLGQGNEVHCLDNLATGTMHNISPLLGDPAFQFVEHDVTTPMVLDVDRIYNLACPASPRHYQADPIRTLKTSVVGALNILDLAAQKNVPVLQASTSEVYGDPEVHPQSEDYWGHVNPIGPRSCYDEGKRAAETLFFDYHRQRGVDIRIARIFNTYGPHMHPNDGRVVANFIIQALQNKPITLYGDGSQTRSFCYVDDLIAGLMALMDKGAGLGAVNLGNPAELPVRELAEIVIELTNSRSPIIHMPLPIDDPRQRCPDIEKARKTLNWTPRVTLEEGLRHTIQYFDAAISAKRHV